MPEKAFDVVGFGALNCDHVLNVDLARAADRERVAESTASYEYWEGGGSAANTIYALGKLGLRTSFVGAVGNDTKAELILDSFRSVGMAEDFVAVKEGPSGIALCVVNEAGRDIHIYPNANRLYSTSDLESAVDHGAFSTRLLHMSSFANHEQFDLQREVAAHLPDDALLSFSPGALYATYGQDQLRPLLDRLDYAFFNAAEMVALMQYRTGEYEAAAKDFMARYPRCKALVLTLGAGKNTGDDKPTPGGIRRMSLTEFLDDDTKLEMDYGITSIIYEPGELPIKVRRGPSSGEVVDTTGAGDAYAAGFLYGVLQHEPVWRAALMGRLIAERSILSMGARRGLMDGPGLQQVLRNAAPALEHRTASKVIG